MSSKKMTSDLKAFLKRDCDNANCVVHHPRNRRKALQNNSNDLMPTTSASVPGSSNQSQSGGSSNAPMAPGGSLAERKVDTKTEDINVQVAASTGALQSTNIVTYITTNNNYVGEQLHHRTAASSQNGASEMKKMEHILKENADLKSLKKDQYKIIVNLKEKLDLATKNLEEKEKLRSSAEETCQKHKAANAVLKRKVGEASSRLKNLEGKNQKLERQACENAITTEQLKSKVIENEEAVRTFEWKLLASEKWATYYQKLAQERSREINRLKRQLGLDTEEDCDYDDASSGPLDTLNTTMLELDLSESSPTPAQSE